MGTARAAVHGKANPTVGQKLAHFDLRNRRFDKLPEYLLLIFGDGGLQILNLRQVLADEHNQGNVAGISYNYNYTLRSYVGDLPILPSIGIRAEL